MYICCLLGEIFALSKSNVLSRTARQCLSLKMSLYEIWNVSLNVVCRLLKRNNHLKMNTNWKLFCIGWKCRCDPLSVLSQRAHFGNGGTNRHRRNVGKADSMQLPFDNKFRLHHNCLTLRKSLAKLQSRFRRRTCTELQPRTTRTGGLHRKFHGHWKKEILNEPFLQPNRKKSKAIPNEDFFGKKKYTFHTRASSGANWNEDFRCELVFAQMGTAEIKTSRIPLYLSGRQNVTNSHRFCTGVDGLSECNNLVQPEANLAPKSMSSPPETANWTETPLVVCKVPDAADEMNAPNIAPKTYTTCEGWHGVRHRRSLQNKEKTIPGIFSVRCFLHLPPVWYAAPVVSHVGECLPQGRRSNPLGHQRLVTTASANGISDSQNNGHL